MSRKAAMSNVADFYNPLLPAPSHDPWVMVHEGMFHALNTDGRRIFLRRSFDVLCLFAQPAVIVWKAPASGPPPSTFGHPNFTDSTVAGSSTTRQMMAASATIASGRSKRRATIPPDPILVAVQSSRAAGLSTPRYCRVRPESTSCCGPAGRGLSKVRRTCISPRWRIR